MDEPVYYNTRSISKSAKKRGNRNCCVENGVVVCVGVFSGLLLSLLANGMLAYLCYYSDGPDGLISCEPVTNCSYLNTDDNARIREIFQKDKKNHTQPLHCPNKNFPETWIKSKGRYYVFSSDVMDWSSSRRRCLDLGADLVIINSHEEQETLAEHVHTVGENALFWIGLTDSQIEGLWRWVDDTNLQKSLSFWDKLPDDNKDANPLGEDCVVLNGRIQMANWGDVSCLRKERSICEIPCSE
ncbi:C-type lectin domain family 4 member E [Danio aesculapii]|uniref:C-type lectin domain family 4 member E n=1 Tax=Danio aesculapii TaxID=1142201 RepID=UPI0024BF48A4|nr:C-type lectin domain family 4 member E [Danio aesculapii]